MLLSASFNMKADGYSRVTTHRHLGINNKNFIQKLDSIVSMTRFTPETPIFELWEEIGKYEDYPANLLSINKYLQIILFDSIPTHPYYDGSKIEKVDTQQTTEFYILIQGLSGSPSYYKYYIFYNKHHYFFNTIIKPYFYRLKKTTEFKHNPLWYFAPFPTWIIKYTNGNIQLIDFYINNEVE